MSQVDGKLLRVAAYLRKSPLVKVSECIMAEKRVDVFKGSAATKALLSPAYAKLTGVPKIENSTQAVTILQDLMNAGLVLRARSVNNTKFLQPDLSRTWSDDALYVWIYEGSQLMTIMASVALLVCILGLMLFPLWPYAIRSKASYGLNILMYLAIGVVIFLIGISIVRMFVYIITYFTLKPGIWIFPNLWEDCGVIESFQPLWDWDKVVLTNDPSSTSKDSSKVVTKDSSENKKTN